MNFPPHKVSLHLTHNQHKAYYETVEQYLSDDERIEFASPEERQKCIDTNELWELQWYPETPVGFHCVGAATLEDCLNFALEN